MRIKLVHINGFDDDLVFSNKPMDIPIEEFEFPNDDISNSLPTATTNTLNFTTSSITLRQPTLVLPPALTVSSNVINNGGIPGPAPTNVSSTSRNLFTSCFGSVNSGICGNRPITESNLSNNPFRVRALPENANNANNNTSARSTPLHLSTPSVPPVFVNNNFAAQGVVVPKTRTPNSCRSSTPIVNTFNVAQPALESSRNSLDCQNMNNNSYTTQTINISTTETIKTTNYVRQQNGVAKRKVQKTVSNSSHLLNGKTIAQKKKILKLLDDIPMKAIRKFAWNYNNFYI